MKKPIWSWNNTLKTLGYKVTRIFKPEPTPTASDFYRPSIESIEPRQMLAGIEVVDLQLVNDNGQYASDLVSSDPRIEGMLEIDDFKFKNYIVEVDWDSDSETDAYAVVESDGHFMFDVRETHLDFIEGSNTPQFRGVKNHLNESRIEGAWEQFSFYQTISTGAVVGVNVDGEDVGSGFRLDLGQTMPGEVVSKTISITNRGASDLVLSENEAITIGFDVVDYPGPITLAPGSSVDITINFEGSDFRNYVGFLVLTGEDTETVPFQLSLAAQIKKPLMEISVDGQVNDSGTIDFGNSSSSAPVTKTISLKNNSEHEVNLDSSFDFPSGFSLSSAPTQLQLLSGETASFQVTFEPGQVGNYSGDLIIRHVGSDSPIVKTRLVGEYLTPRLEMSLNGTDYSSDLNSLDFGTTLQGNSVQRSFWLRNSGTEDIAIQSIVTPSGWQFVSTPPTILNAGTSVELQIEYMATDTGYVLGTFSVETDNVHVPFHEFFVHGTSVNIANVRLFNDTGASQSDTLTSDTRIFGEVLGGASAEDTWIEFTVDGQPYPQQISADGFDHFLHRIYVETGVHQIGARLVVGSDPQTQQHSPWSFVDVDYDPEIENSPIEIQNVALSLNLGSPEAQESYDSTIVGSISNDGNIDKVVVLFDHDGNGEPDGYAITDASGNFEYDPQITDPGQYSFSIWASEVLPDGTDQFSDVFEFNFVVTNAPPAQVDELSLVRDSGDSDSDDRTSFVSFEGSILTTTDSDSYHIEWDLNGDGIADGTALVDEQLNFEFEPVLFGPGEYQLRIRVVDELYDVNSEWSDPYIFELESMQLPTITQFQLVDDTGDPNDKITANPDVVGTVESEYRLVGQVVEFDIDQDGLSDAEAYTDENGQFIFSPDVKYGDVTLNYRSTIFDEVTSTFIFGDWIEFNYRFEPDGDGLIEDFQLLNDDGFDDSDRVTSDPTVTGLATYDGYVYSFAQIEFDYDGDNEIDATTFANEIGVFQHLVNVDYGSHVVRARVKTYDYVENDYTVGDWALLDFEYAEFDHTSIDGPEGANELLDFAELDAADDKTAYLDSLEIAFDAFNQHIIGGEIFGTNSLTSQQIDALDGFDFAFGILQPLSESISFSPGEFYKHAFQNGHIRSQIDARNPFHDSVIGLESLDDYSNSIDIFVEVNGQRIDGDLVFSFDAGVNLSDQLTLTVVVEFDFTVTEISTSKLLHEGAYKLTADGIYDSGSGGTLPGGQNPQGPGGGSASGFTFELEETGSFKSFHDYATGNGANGGTVNVEAEYSFDNDYVNHENGTPFTGQNANNFSRKETLHHEITFTGQQNYSENIGSALTVGTKTDQQSLIQTSILQSSGEYRENGSTPTEESDFQYDVLSKYDRTLTNVGTYETKGPEGTNAGDRDNKLVEYYEYEASETGSYERTGSEFISLNNTFEHSSFGWEITENKSLGDVTKDDVIQALGFDNPDTHAGTTEGAYDYDNHYDSHSTGTYSVSSSGFESIANTSTANSFASDSVSITLAGDRAKHFDGLNSTTDYESTYVATSQSKQNHDGTFVNKSGSLATAGSSSSYSKLTEEVVTRIDTTFEAPHASGVNSTHTGTYKLDSTYKRTVETTTNYDQDTAGGIDLSSGSFNTNITVEFDETTSVTNTYQQHKQPRRITTAIQQQVGQGGSSTSGAPLPGDIYLTGTSSSTTIIDNDTTVTDVGSFYRTDGIESKTNGVLTQVANDKFTQDSTSDITYEYSQGATDNKTRIESTEHSERTHVYNDTATYWRLTFDGVLPPTLPPGSPASPTEFITGTFSNEEVLKSSIESTSNGTANSDYGTSIELLTFSSEDKQSFESTYNDNGTYESTDGVKESSGSFDLYTVTNYEADGESTLSYTQTDPTDGPTFPRPITNGVPVTAESSLTTSTYYSDVDTTYKIDAGEGTFTENEFGTRYETASFTFTESSYQTSESTTNGSRTELHRFPWQSPYDKLDEQNANAVDLEYYMYVDSMVDLTMNEYGKFTESPGSKVVEADFDYVKDSYTDNKSKIDTWIVEDDYHGMETSEVDSKIDAYEEGNGDYEIENTSQTPGPITTTNRFYDLTQTTDNLGKITFDGEYAYSAEQKAAAFGYTRTGSIDRSSETDLFITLTENAVHFSDSYDAESTLTVGEFTLEQENILKSFEKLEYDYVSKSTAFGTSKGTAKETTTIDQELYQYESGTFTRDLETQLREGDRTHENKTTTYVTVRDKGTTTNDDGTRYYSNQSDNYQDLKYEETKGTFNEYDNTRSGEFKEQLLSFNSTTDTYSFEYDYQGNSLREPALPAQFDPTTYGDTPLPKPPTATEVSRDRGNSTGYTFADSVTYNKASGNFNFNGPDSKQDGTFVEVELFHAGSGVDSKGKLEFAKENDVEYDNSDSSSSFRITSKTNGVIDRNNIPVAGSNDVARPDSYEEYTYTKRMVEISKNNSVHDANTLPKIEEFNPSWFGFTFGASFDPATNLNGRSSQLVFFGYHNTFDFPATYIAHHVDSEIISIDGTHIYWENGTETVGNGEYTSFDINYTSVQTVTQTHDRIYEHHKFADINKNTGTGIVTINGESNETYYRFKTIDAFELETGTHQFSKPVDKTGTIDPEETPIGGDPVNWLGDFTKSGTTYREEHITETTSHTLDIDIATTSIGFISGSYLAAGKLDASGSSVKIGKTVQRIEYTAAGIGDGITLGESQFNLSVDDTIHYSFEQGSSTLESEATFDSKGPTGFTDGKWDYKLENSGQVEYWSSDVTDVKAAYGPNASNHYGKAQTDLEKELVDLFPDTLLGNDINPTGYVDMYWKEVSTTTKEETYNEAIVGSPWGAWTRYSYDKTIVSPTDHGYRNALGESGTIRGTTYTEHIATTWWNGFVYSDFNTGIGWADLPEDNYGEERSELEKLQDYINENYGEILDYVQYWLDWIGIVGDFIPVIGTTVAIIADGLNGTISLVRGNYVDAAFNFAAMIPYAGIAATGTKWASKLGKAAKSGIKYGSEAAGIASEVAVVAKALKGAGQSISKAASNAQAAAARGLDKVRDVFPKSTHHIFDYAKCKFITGNCFVSGTIYKMCQQEFENQSPVFVKAHSSEEDETGVSFGVWIAATVAGCMLVGGVHCHRTNRKKALAICPLN